MHLLSLDQETRLDIGFEALPQSLRVVANIAVLCQPKFRRSELVARLT
jgi:hypothetical protein